MYFFRLKIRKWMYKLLLTMLVLIIAGIGLSLSLPKIPATTKESATVEIDQKSEESPIPLKSFYLQTPTPKEARYTLQLGMYARQIEAKQLIRMLPNTERYIIIKTVDGTRNWYLVLQGHYASREKALLAQQNLKADHISSSLRLLPVESKEK